MPTITHPQSRLVNSSVPFRAAVRLEGAAEGTPVSVRVTLRREGEGAGDVSLRAEAQARAGSDALAVTLPVDALAAGDYTGELTVTVAGDETTCPVSLHRMPEPLAEPFPYGIYAVPLPADDPELCRRRLREVRDCGIDLICQHTDQMPALAPLMDEAGRMGIRFMPSTNLRVRPGEVGPECLDVLSYEPDSDDSRRGVCRANPTVREKAREMLAGRLKEYQAHAGFSGLVYYGDDLFLRARCEHATAAISCYCEVCRAGFRARTGLEAPTNTAPAAGVVPADHPWLQWMRYRCGETFGGLVRELDAVREAVAPDAKMGLCHGFPHAPFTAALHGIYGPLSQPTSHARVELPIAVNDEVGEWTVAVEGGFPRGTVELPLSVAEGSASALRLVVGE